MKEKLLSYAEDFLDYLFDVRGYSEHSITTYEIALRQMMEVSHFYEEEGFKVLDITPFRFTIVKNSKKTIAAFIQLDTGIDYDAVDKVPVDLLFALVVPEDSTEEHLQTLATLAEIFSDTTTLGKLRQSNSSAEMYSILTG